MPETPPTFETVIYERHGRVARIVLNRPPVNAISVQLSRELNRALDFARGDEEVRAVILTGAGEQAFSAGIDLKEFEPATGHDMRRFIETLYHEMVAIQYRMGKPTIAALNGPALAAGVTVAVSCDVLIASERAASATRRSTSASGDVSSSGPWPDELTYPLSARPCTWSCCHASWASTRRSSSASPATPSTPTRRTGWAW